MKEGLKQPSLVFRRYSYSGVGDRESHTLVSIGPPNEFRPDFNTSFCRKFQRVADEVVENLAQSHGINQQRRADLRVDVALQVKAFAARVAGEDVAHRLYRRFDGSNLWTQDAQGASIEFRLRASDSSLRWVENRYVPVRDGDGRLIEVDGIIIDVTERKAAEDKISHLARTDGLTSLANRSTFIERLSQAFASAQRGALAFAILYLDLDKFKPVNDSFGHPIGDLLLRQVAERLKSFTRESDLVARLGGDEFAILQGEMREPANAGVLAANIQAALARPYLINDNEINISVSIGISAYVAGHASADAMLAQADLALYRSKEDGRNQYHFHSQDLDQDVLDRVTLAGEIRRAIAQDEFELQYQPQVELSSQDIVGMEALVRWNHPTRGLLAPGLFIPIAEKTGSIVALGNWVLDRACRQMSIWRREGLILPVMAVNLSFFQLTCGQELVRDVTQTIAKWGLKPSDIEFDVTEATLARLTWTDNAVLPRLGRLGVKIAIDDFGSEYSSFDYVRAYRVNHLKIARSFIKRSTSDPQSAATIRAIVNFAHDIGIVVIAQGVETEQQRELLSTTDTMTQAQGFHFSKAVGADSAGELLRRGRIASFDESPTDKQGETELCDIQRMLAQW